LFVLFKAVDYWLDRYDLSNSSGHLFTGIGYTDQHAVLPSKNILTFIALICALLFFANIFRRTWLLPTIGLGLLVLSAILLGAIWPGIVQHFQVSPSEPDKEAPYLAKNIAATRSAYDIANSKVSNFNPAGTLTAAQVKQDQSSIEGVRLLDPGLVSPTFEQLQQVRGYYSFSHVLDVDRYRVDGHLRDMVLSDRELDQSGLPPTQRNWANLHTVYTHGYGVVAAYGNQRDAQNQPVTNNDGEPVWAERDIPPIGDLTNMTKNGYQPRIYYGENSSDYSIVGKRPGGPNLELDTPQGTGSTSQTSTYAGSTGVPVGSLFNKLLYALKFSEPNIVLSSRVNPDSRILYDRDPRFRLQQVAPWLTVDSDPYPAVVNGRVKWILDGYTTTDRYPESEKQSLSSMTSDSLNPRTNYATLPNDQINYMRNSVKAVVDAYSGTVTLYAWDKDPILRAWSAAFPGVVHPRSQIPPALLAHMRYPEDMFKVQRYMLAPYHVTNPHAFYAGSDRWRVPEDPENKGKTQPPYRLSVRTPGDGPNPVFSLTGVYVPYLRQNLASFISVDSDPSKADYGTIHILRLPSNTQTPGPSQVANTFGGDAAIQGKLVAFTKANSKALFGNLLTLPVGNGLLYVQPLYTERVTGQGLYPVLRYVLVSFGKEVGVGTTLDNALADMLGVAAPSNGAGNGTVQGGGNTTGAPLPENVRLLLRQAEQKFVQAQAALKRGDLNAYASAQSEARSLVDQALKAADKANATAKPSPSAQPSSKQSPTPKQ
jgi:uncharacterized membrane protein (UPF0182 family)